MVARAFQIETSGQSASRMPSQEILTNTLHIKTV